MTKTARRKQRKAQRSQRKAQQPRPATPRATPAIANPFDLTPQDIEAAAQAQQTAQQAAQQKAQRGGQHKVPVIGGNSSAKRNQQADYSETILHAPPVRNLGRCGPVAPDVLYFEAWRAFIRADKAQYKPRHFLGISPIWW